MTYKINDTDIGVWGITPSPFSGSTMAIKGALDFPKRKGTTEYSWGTETEAFTEADDLEWNGRDIYFRGFIRANSRSELITNIDLFSDECKTGVLSFETPLGTFSVILKDTIKVTEYVDNNAAFIEAKFYQETISFQGTSGIPSGGSGILLDGFSLIKDFGIYIESRTGHLDTPSRLDIKTTASYMGVSNRKPRDIKLKCTLLAASLPELQTQLNQLYKLLSSPNLKLLTFPNTGFSNKVYIKDGIQISNILVGQKATAQFYFKVREPNPE